MAEKITAVIVDDEYLERNLIKNCIDWEMVGIEIAGEAANADDALKLIEKVKPDIMFTDINMPVVDGFKLSKIVIDRFSDIKIVIVTGYDDFEYARKGIKMGISDFIVKPISDEEVLKTAMKLKEEIERSRSENEEQSELRRQFYDNLPYIREKFYNELILGITDEEAENERMAFLGINLKSSSYQTAALECGGSQNGDDEKTSFLNAMRILNRAKEYFKGMTVFFDTMSRIVIINCDPETDLYDACEKFISLNPKSTVCIGVGTIKTSLHQISASYREAIEALRYRVAVGDNSVILHNSIQARSGINGDGMDELTEKLVFGVKSSLYDSALKAAGKMLDLIDIKSEDAIKKIRVTTGNINALCMKVLFEYGADIDYIYNENLKVNGGIEAVETLPQAKEFVGEIIKSAIGKMGNANRHKINDLVLGVKEYIDKNYSNSKLSLTSVAGRMFLNPSYLSRTFKKEAGISFVEYLTRVRMENALRYLKQNEYKAFEIAEMVGIPDANYFCSCFKKYFGVSLSEFKKAGKNA